MFQVDTFDLVDAVEDVEEDEESAGQEEKGGCCQPCDLQHQHEEHCKDIEHPATDVLVVGVEAALTGLAG